jgi:cGMP-dependent protein kinase
MGCAGSKDAASKPAKQPEKTEEQGATPQDRDKDKKAAKDGNKELLENVKFIGNVPLFKRLPTDQHPIVASALKKITFSAGDTVIKEGDSGSEFFLIKEGEGVVNAGGQQVASLKAGDYFGETALLRDAPRTATIVAGKAGMVALKLSREDFNAQGLQEKIVWTNRKAVGGGGPGAGKAKEARKPDPKTAQQVQLISKAIENNENLQTMVPLDKDRIQQMVDCAWTMKVDAGTEVIKEGDLDADYFYVVESGRFEVLVKDDPDNMESGQVRNDAFEAKGGSQVVTTVGPEGSFGELALLYLVPRAATVKATEPAVLWCIARNHFKDILMKVSDAKIKEYLKHLESVAVFNSLLAGEKKEVAKALIEMHFAKGEVILQQGEPGNTFYILYDGDVEIIKDGNKVSDLKASPAKSQAQYFGEKALLGSGEVRAATVRVTSETAKALALDRDSFLTLLPPLEELQKGGRQESATKGGAAAQAAKGGMERGKILRKDLARIGLLGCGGFGAVELWEHKTTGETYAMKGLSKGYVVKTGMQESVMNEKHILMMTNSDFITKLHETFNGAQTLYFLLEPALGGELYATYNRKGFHGSSKHCQFYSAGVVYAFEHLHERHILYRDLKPENLLLDTAGRLKLTDMGLAKFVVGKSFTTCGTPDYFAPELIASTGHTKAVDWWTLGILIFELMSGHPPFESAYPMQIYSKVMKGIGKVNFPPKCKGPVESLIRDLLKREPSERLPMKQGGLKLLKDHAFYAKDGLNWQLVWEQKADVPYKPSVKSKKDIANFSARKEDMPKQIEYRDDGTNWDKDFATSK